LQLVQAPGDLQNESADHLAEEQNHDERPLLKLRELPHRICDPLEDFP
jgi:hypothetical protein